MSLFNMDDKSKPFAERLKPKTLDDFYGQEDVLGEGKNASAPNSFRQANLPYFVRPFQDAEKQAWLGLLQSLQRRSLKS